MATGGERGELLTSAEVARRLSVSVGTVERWRFERTGPPPIRLGARLVRYRAADVARFERARRGHRVESHTH